VLSGLINASTSTEHTANTLKALMGTQHARAVLISWSLKGLFSKKSDPTEAQLVAAIQVCTAIR